MTKTLHFTLGPVQSFVSQARRTRDLWAGSFLLSYLSGQAMKAVLEFEPEGAKIAFPYVGTKKQPTDALLAAILGTPLSSDPKPQIGSLPNRFKANVPDDFDPERCERAVKDAWKKVADAVWYRYVFHVAEHGLNTQSIWSRQVEAFWDMAWVMGVSDDPKVDGAWLGRRKNWRTYHPPEEGGDHCTLMGDWQELSGFIRAQQKGEQDGFWEALRRKLGKSTLELGEHERLSVIALIKRLYPKASETAIGWKLEVSSWPSTSYMAAVPWLGKIQTNPDAYTLARKYSVLVNEHVQGNISEEYSTDLDCLKGEGFTRLDGQLYFRHALESDKERNLSAEAKRELQTHLSKLNDAVGHPPSPFYALLLMDGDNLGKLLQHEGLEPAHVSKALARFTESVDRIVRNYCGKTVYAGGDDVLALLPLDQALAAATELRKSYLGAFNHLLGAERPVDGENKPLETTISAGLVFAHFHTSLRAVMREAHYLLDAVAKDGNERDSVAVSVLTGSGRTVEWVSSWDEQTVPKPIPHIVQNLVARFEQEEQFASKFFYNARARFEILTGDEDERKRSGYTLTDGLDAGRLLVAEYQKSRERDVPLEEAEERVGQLLRVCRVRKNGQEDPKTLNIEGAMLVRFLATKGRGVER